MTPTALRRDEIRCPGCGRVLGELVGPLFVMRHHGRRFVSTTPLCITCEACHATWLNSDAIAALPQLADVVAWLNRREA